MPVLIASMAGRLNPSYRLGTTASSASAYSSTMRSSGTPDTKSMYGRRPSLSMRSALAPARGLPMMVRRMSSRSVRSLAMASSRYARPFSATSADAVVISRPGWRTTWGIGWNSCGSTPTGTRRMRSYETPMSSWMSLMLFSLTTTMRGMRLATRPCIFTNAYQRAMLCFFHHVFWWAISSARSRVIGW